ncbi:MAG: GyrI-like domain-containing protein [Bacteroidota bacterium]
MEPRIENISEKKLVGHSLNMSLAADKTPLLWGSFMPKRKEIKNAISTDLMSVQVVDPFYFKELNPTKEFQKWAAVEVTDFNTVPEGMSTFTLPAGLYAVFIHKGPASTGAKTFQYIFENWLPQSAYAWDPRPHFELLGEKYKNNNPDSEEEIWIPVKAKHIV